MVGWLYGLGVRGIERPAVETAGYAYEVRLRGLSWGEIAAEGQVPSLQRHPERSEGSTSGRVCQKRANPLASVILNKVKDQPPQDPANRQRTLSPVSS